MTAAGYYVTIRDGPRTSFALGPFHDHARARFELPWVRRYVTARYPFASFWSFGTARIRYGSRPAGKLNHVRHMIEGDA